MKIWSVAAITIYSRICRNTGRVNTKGVWLENLLKMRMNPFREYLFSGIGKRGRNRLTRILIFY
jgi:hypothetical protein